MFNESGCEMARSSGFALVKGSAVLVLTSCTLREAVERATKANRFDPLELTRVAKVTFVYAGMGKVEDVKVGRFVF